MQEAILSKDIALYMKGQVEGLLGILRGIESLKG